MMENTIRCCIGAVLALSLWGCAGGQPPLPKMKTYFVTKIDAQGSKRFDFSMIAFDLHQRHRQQNAPGGDRLERRPGEGPEGEGEGRQRPQGGEPTQRGERRGGRAGGGDDITELETQLVAALEEALKANGYCRDGYYQLDSYVSRERSFLRGECRETATAADRQRFSDDAD